jgi:diguanylate cyclase (GGDEF)-like protein
MHRQAGARRDTSADERDHAAQQRDDTSDVRDHDRDERDQAADERDRAGDERDVVADARDRAADRRDAAAQRRDERAERAEESTYPELTVQAQEKLRDVRASAAADRAVSAGDRQLNAADRAYSAGARENAEVDRITASTDRRMGDNDREHAEADRQSSSDDRLDAATDRESSHLDELTGAYRRGPGLLELQREVSRATRTSQPLAVLFVDVDHLKQVNDSQGHTAGDRLLQDVGMVLASKMRSYDLLMRYGGDEFVCVLAGVSGGVAAGRMAQASTTLLSLPSRGSMSIGVAELIRGDTAATLVERADDDMYRRRQLLR